MSVFQGGPYSVAVDGLREGLRELGFEEGKQFTLHVRDAKGDLKAVEPAARDLERDNVDLIYSVTTTVTLATRGATKRVPIVFYAGADPVAMGLVENFRKPGGRLTGVHGQQADLTAKRLEVLKAMMPRLRRVVVFYSPDNPAARSSLAVLRDAARQLKVELVERRVASVEELRASLRSLRPGEVDALVYVADAMVTSQTDAIIDAARMKRLPTMFQEPASVAMGALASYGISLHAAGRLSAKQVQRVLQGAAPGDLPVEQLARPHFAAQPQDRQGARPDHPQLGAGPGRRGHPVNQSLVDALGVKRDEVVALVGGGGKSAAMFRLAREVAEGGRARDHDHHHAHLRRPDRAGARARPRRGGEPRGARHRAGPPSARAGDRADQSRDKSRRRHLARSLQRAARLVPGRVPPQRGRRLAHASLQGPAAHEPVIPAGDDSGVPMVGADVFGKPLDADHVHRPELVAR